MMNKVMVPIIKPAELMAMHESGNLVIVDASAGKGAKERYAAKHLQGALYVDLDSELADIQPDVAIGGRHPLPSPARFSQTLQNLGITPGSHVVVYDDKNGSNAAARFWWMLKSAGHETVQVLDGGPEAAVAAGFPIAAGEEKRLKGGQYEFTNWTLPVAHISEIDSASTDDHSLIVDVRDAERYRGEKEPIDLIAGHIPGAVNIPFTSNLDANGFYLLPDELKTNYSKAFGDKSPENIMVHCGSGVTACHTLLALAYAGFAIPKLYVGSWSEWSRNNRPMVTKDE